MLKKYKSFIIGLGIILVVGFIISRLMGIYLPTGESHNEDNFQKFVNIIHANNLVKHFCNCSNLNLLNYQFTTSTEN